MHDRDVAGQQVGELRQEQRRAAGRPSGARSGAPGVRGGGQRGQDRRHPPRSRARRRRPRRSCPCAPAASALPFSAGVNRAPGPRRRCRCAATPPSAADRRAWGSAGPVPAASIGCTGKGANRSRIHHRPEAAGSGQRRPVRVQPLAQARDQADAGDHRVARHATCSNSSGTPTRRAASQHLRRAASALGKGTTR